VPLAVFPGRHSDAKVEQELKTATDQLNATKFADSAVHQQKVIDGLSKSHAMSGWRIGWRHFSATWPTP